MARAHQVSALVLGTTLAVGLGVAALAAGTGTVDPPPRIAFVARGDVAADALAVGPVAGRLGAPVFTTATTELVEAARQGLVAHDPELVIVAGGTVAITEDVRTQIAQALGLPLGDVRRVDGLDRYDTARQVAALIEEFNPAFLPVDATAADADLLDGLDSTAFLRTTDDVDADLLDGRDSTFFASLSTVGVVPVAQGAPVFLTLPTADYTAVATTSTLDLPDLCPGDAEATWLVETRSALKYNLAPAATGTQEVGQRHALVQGGTQWFSGYANMPVLDIAAETTLTGVGMFVGFAPGTYTMQVQAVGLSAAEAGDDVRTTGIGGQTVAAIGHFTGCAP